jgi:hypothetical protein
VTISRFPPGWNAASRPEDRLAGELHGQASRSLPPHGGEDTREGLGSCKMISIEKEEIIDRIERLVIEERDDDGSDLTLVQKPDGDGSLS